MATVETKINIASLADHLAQIVRTDFVRVRQIHGEIRIIPAKENYPECPLRGIASDLNYSVADFIAEKQLERDREPR
jgi:hypothetical protein